MNKLLILQGKHYKARNGSKILIDYISQRDIQFPLHGWDETHGVYVTYCKDGTFYERDNESPLDLVEAWQDESEVVTLYAGVYWSTDGCYLWESGSRHLTKEEAFAKNLKYIVEYQAVKV